MREGRSFLACLFCTVCLFIAIGQTQAAPGQPAAPSPQKLFAEGKFAQVRDAYEALVKQYPKRLDFHIGLVRTFLRLDDWHGALNAGNDALQYGGNNGDVIGLYSLIMFRAGLPDVAAKHDARALKLNPKSYWALVAAGDLAIWNDQQSKALSYFDRASRINPKEPDAWLGILNVNEDVDNPVIRGYDADQQRATKAYLKMGPKGYPHDFVLSVLLTEVQPAALKLSQKVQAHPPTIVAPVTEAELEKLDRGAGVFSTTVPIEVKDGQIWVPVTINGHALHMIFDTGGEGVILSRKAIAQLKMKAGSKTQSWGAQGALNQDNYLADNMDFGGLVINPMPISAADTPALDRDGIFGAPILEHFLITVDYKKKTMTLSRGRDAVPPDPGPSDTHIIVPFHYIHHKMILPVSIDAKSKWQSTSSWAVFDTGAAGCYLSLPTAQRMSEGMAPSDIAHGTITGAVALGKTATRIDWVAIKPGPYLTLGDSTAYVWKRWEDGMMGLSFINKVLSPHIGIELSALLGEPYTEEGTRFTIDYRRHLLTIDYPSPPTTAGQSDKSQAVSPSATPISATVKQGS